jgi:hypothetical protein
MCDGFRFLRGPALQGCENWLSLIAALQTAEKLEDSRFLSRTHASYQGMPSGIPQVAENGSGFSRCGDGCSLETSWLFSR